MSGRHETALALLHNDRSPGSSFFRTRAFFRMGFFERALLEIDETDFALVEDEEALLLSLSRSFLLTRLGRLDEASESLSQLRKNNHSKFDDTTELEYLYCAAYIAYCRGEHDLARVELSKILGKTELISADRRRYAFQQDAFAIRSKAATLLGVLAATLDKFKEMERWHCEALLSAEKSRPRDIFLESVILGNLSCAVGEVYCPTAVTLLQDRLESIDWTAGMAEQRLYLERHLIRAKRLFGIGRICLSPGSVASPSLAWRLAESVDRLFLDDWPSLDSYTEELMFAKSFLDRVDWMSTIGEEDTNLDELAALLAPFDAEAAVKAQSQLETKLDVSLPHYPTGRTIRDRASKSFALACIAKARGDFALAERQFSWALDALLPSEISWRVAVVSIELYTLNRERSLLEAPRAFLSAHRASAFSGRMGRALIVAESSEEPGAFPYLCEAIAARTK